MNKAHCETVLTIVIFFLSALLLLGVLNGKITALMLVGALSLTYLFVRYWRRHTIAPAIENEIKNEEI